MKSSLPLAIFSRMFTNLQHESEFSFNFVALPVCQQQQQLLLLLLLLRLPSEELLLQEVELRPVVSCRDELSRVCLGLPALKPGRMRA